MSLPIYNKGHTKYQDQITLLESRGLYIPDHSKAIKVLTHEGYYRYSGYLYPFRQKNSDYFYNGTTFQQVLDLLNFDAKLRSIILTGLSIFEVGCRANLAYQLGSINAFAHTEKQYLDLQRCETVNQYGVTAHDRWVQGYEKSKGPASDKDYVVNFKSKYQGEIPIWIAIEFMDFGNISYLFPLAPLHIRKQVSSYFGCLRDPQFESSLKSLNALRNACAHQEQIWNIKLPWQTPKIWAGCMKSNNLDHLIHFNNRTLYKRLAILTEYILSTSMPHGIVWQKELKSHLLTFPSSGTHLSLQYNSGFPINWDTGFDLWK